MFEAIRAWWRGEKRVQPSGVRGRVYERKESLVEPQVKARTVPKVTVKTRVIKGSRHG